MLFVTKAEHGDDLIIHNRFDLMGYWFIDYCYWIHFGEVIIVFRLQLVAQVALEWFRKGKDNIYFLQNV